VAAAGTPAHRSGSVEEVVTVGMVMDVVVTVVLLVVEPPGSVDEVLLVVDVEVLVLPPG
jgi:hypothetical protein